MIPQVTTIKPTSIHQSTPVVEYGVLNEAEDDYVLHGVQLTLTPENVADLAEAQALIDAVVLQDARVKGHVTPPDDWVAPVEVEEVPE